MILLNWVTSFSFSANSVKTSFTKHCRSFSERSKNRFHIKSVWSVDNLAALSPFFLPPFSSGSRWAPRSFWDSRFSTDFTSLRKFLTKFREYLSKKKYSNTLNLVCKKVSAIWNCQRISAINTGYNENGSNSKNKSM